MKNKRVVLLDIGLDDSFNASMVFAQSVLQNINEDEPMADIDFVRSHDLRTVATAFTAECDVLHVMGHGDHSEVPQFVDAKGEFTVSFEDLGDWAANTLGQGISAAAVLAEGCKTGIGVWQHAVRDCLQGPITYIGTSASVGWHQSTVFCASFYGALLRHKGKGIAPAEQAKDAAIRAVKAYELLVDKTCPFKVTTLQPSTKARHHFGLD